MLILPTGIWQLLRHTHKHTHEKWRFCSSSSRWHSALRWFFGLSLWPACLCFPVSSLRWPSRGFVTCHLFFHCFSQPMNFGDTELEGAWYCPKTHTTTTATYRKGHWLLHSYGGFGFHLHRRSTGTLLLDTSLFHFAGFPAMMAEKRKLIHRNRDRWRRESERRESARRAADGDAGTAGGAILRVRLRCVSCGFAAGCSDAAGWLATKARWQTTG